MATHLCPLLKKECIEHSCRWYIQILGADPQTGEQLNKWGCAIEFMPMLLIENAKEVRQTAAAVESARNESVSNSRLLASAMVAISRSSAARKIADPCTNGGEHIWDAGHDGGAYGHSWGPRCINCGRGQLAGTLVSPDVLKT